jgi:hypothetical protein
MAKVACIIGFLAAGFFRIPEVLLEWLFVT